VPLSPQARRLLDRFAEAKVEPYDRMSVLEARASVAASLPLGGPAPDVAHVRDLLVAGADGQLPARLYHPAPGTTPPLLVYFHGGGWVTGSVEITDTACRLLARATGCVVASVDYRRSPETRFPGPTEDAYAATVWLAGHAGAIGADAGRLVVCGDSAGGNLAAAVTLLARDRGGPRIAFQVLLYAALQAMPGPGFPSHHENGEGYGLTLSGMRWFWEHFLGPGGDGDDPYASPLLADLSRLPPAFLVVGSYDVLRDETLAYAERLQQAGVPAEVLVYPGAIHGFFWMAKALDEGREIHTAIAERLERRWCEGDSDEQD
jgi:acetyl esterase